MRHAAAMPTRRFVSKRLPKIRLIATLIALTGAAL
jgi:hypothetical protein